MAEEQIHLKIFWNIILSKVQLSIEALAVNVSLLDNSFVWDGLLQEEDWELLPDMFTKEG